VKGKNLTPNQTRQKKRKRKPKQDKTKQTNNKEEKKTNHKRRRYQQESESKVNTSLSPSYTWHQKKIAPTKTIVLANNSMVGDWRRMEIIPTYRDTDRKEEYPFRQPFLFFFLLYLFFSFHFHFESERE